MTDEKIKALANSILEQCCSQGLTLRELQQLHRVLTARVDDAIQAEKNRALEKTMNLDLFKLGKH